MSSELSSQQVAEKACARMDYDLVFRQAEGLLSVSRDRIANAANLSALLFHSLEEVNWVGFYFLRSEQLVLGPFQGQPACVEIPLGAGVCGTAAAEQEIQRVADEDEEVSSNAAEALRALGPEYAKGLLQYLTVEDPALRQRYAAAIAIHGLSGD